MHTKPFFALALLITASCSTNSPEDAARSLAEKECECRHITWDFEDKVAEQVLDYVKANATVTILQANDKRIELMQADQDANRLERAPCNRAVEELKNKLKVDFARPDDRATIDNLYRALKEQCEKDHRTAVKDREHWGTVINERAKE